MRDVSWGYVRGVYPCDMLRTNLQLLRIAEVCEKRNSSWRAVLPAEHAAVAVRVAREVTARLREPGVVEAAATAATHQSAFPRSTHWLPYAVSQGYAGLAIMDGYLDASFPGEGWDLIGRHHLERAARGAEGAAPLMAGMFSGLSGLAFAAWQLSHGGVRYRNLLAQIEAVLAPETIALAAHLSEEKRGVSVSDFDVISGLSGVGAYLLCRRDQPLPATALQALLRCLVALTQEEDGVPRWHTPPHLIMDEGMRLHFPHGNLNCGLAHGLPGILAVLALARLAHLEAQGLADAIAHVADWLSRHRVDDPWGVNWPTAVALEREETATGPILRPGVAAGSSDGPGRAAWCYGSPGVARSLWLAGEALDHDGYRDLAVAAMEAVYRRPIHERRIDSPTFCHGVAGLLQITLRFAHDTGLPLFTDAACNLTAQLLALYRPDSLLGYRNLEIPGSEVDQPGLLDGAPGVAMVLLAAATDAEPTWDRLFLLS